MTGTGLISGPHKSPQVTVVGNLDACAQSLAQLWKRKVIVPTDLRGKQIRKRTLRGTPEEIAKVLGLVLGSANRQR
jgi:hypothetical protein